MSTSRRSELRMIDLRLGQAGEQIDTIVARVRDGHGLVNGRTFWRVDALRAHEARVRGRVREVREADQSAWTEGSAQLRRDLLELETQIAISGARLDADLAVGGAAFVVAVQAELDAWAAYVHAAAATQRAELDDYLAVVRSKLGEFRDAAPSSALRIGVSQAVEDLDRAAAQRCASVQKHTND
jgi:hypothetical protein